VLRDVEDMSTTDAAEVLEITEDNVKDENGPVSIRQLFPKTR
jgi:hypothetical protein